MPPPWSEALAALLSDRQDGQPPLNSQTMDSNNAPQQPFSHPPLSPRPPLQMAAPSNGRAMDRGGHGGRGNMFRGRRTGRRELSRAAVVASPDWDHYRSVVMQLCDVPQEATTWDIMNNLGKHGTVSHVELDETPRAGSRTARLRFEPPPRDTSFFQSGWYRLYVNGRDFRVRIIVHKHRAENGAIKSPLGNTCPSLAVVVPAQLTFGILTQPTTVMSKHTVRPLGPDLELSLVVDFKRRKLMINFPVGYKARGSGGPTLGQAYKIELRFSDINNIHRVDLNEERSALVMALDDAPQFWRRRSNIRPTFPDDRTSWAEADLWFRVVEIGWEKDASAKLAASLDNDYQVIDPGRWATYWMELDAPAKAQWASIETHLKDWNIKTQTQASFQLIRGRKAGLWKMLDGRISASPTRSLGRSWNEDLALLGSSPHLDLPFAVRYQLEVCISHGLLSEYNIERDFIEKLLDLSNPESLDPDRARFVLEYVADQGRRVYDPMSVFEDRAAMTYYPATAEIPSHCALVRKVIITPTRVYFTTPTVETTNRVIRHFKEFQEYFMRIQFTDEMGHGRIHASDVQRDDEIYARAYRILNRGIRMGRWHWKFLAFGNSQVRENGAFMFCEQFDTHGGAVLTCDMIRKWMGQFDHIKVIAKYAARLGQCFSTTRLFRGIQVPEIVGIPDVERNGHCFTDGVGKISRLLAKLVADDWKLGQVPSAFQFRMGGCKGILVTWPDAKRLEVHVRKSQEKFSAQFNGLEIIRCSSYSIATLNRQTITILSSLGVPDRVFVDMMREQLSNYDEAMKDRAKAIDLLERYVDRNQMTLTLACMARDGFMETQEPFVQTILQLWRTWSLKQLKEKARLVVDDSAFVLGCVDETGTLRGHSNELEGRATVEQGRLPQIFLQVRDPADPRTYKVITGPCLVGRNPSLHPGDIRVVEAVDVPALRHIRDVVVFPLQGDKDVPGMCSGGDLDGDDFFVMWNQKLLPREWCWPPMDYTPPKPLEEPDGCTADSLKTFFVAYMKNNTLPLIALAHLATADYEEDGAKNPKCTGLARLHSMAVDFVKTGVHAEFLKKYNPRRWPHFMERNDRITYHSTKVLGKLYDMVKKERFDSLEAYRMPFDDRILKRYQPLDDELLKKARRVKSQYDTAMRRIMGQLEIETEFEVWTTFVLSKPRVGTDYKLQETVGWEAAALKQQYRDLCIKEAGGSGDSDALDVFVAAMYQVTCEEVRIAFHEFSQLQPQVLADGTVGMRRRRITQRSLPLISFPWLFAATLGRIAVGRDEAVVADSGEDASPPQPKAQEQPRSPAVEQDLEAAADYARTDDGRIIHRGEVLHLFRHDDDDDDYEDYGVDLLADIVYDTPTTPVMEGAEESTSPESASRAGESVLEATDETALALPRNKNENEPFGLAYGPLSDKIIKAFSELSFHGHIKAPTAKDHGSVGKGASDGNGDSNETLGQFSAIHTALLEMSPSPSASEPFEGGDGAAAAAVAAASAREGFPPDRTGTPSHVARGYAGLLEDPSGDESDGYVTAAETPQRSPEKTQTAANRVRPPPPAFGSRMPLPALTAFSEPRSAVNVSEGNGKGVRSSPASASELQVLDTQGSQGMMGIITNTLGLVSGHIPELPEPGQKKDDEDEDEKQEYEEEVVVMDTGDTVWDRIARFT